MNSKVRMHLAELMERYPVLEECRSSIEEAYKILENCYENGNKLLIAGNGGSSADSQHMVAELMKGFCLSRDIGKDFTDALIEIDEEMGSVLKANLQRSLPAIALDGHSSLTTAYMNDCNPLLCFAQQLNGYGQEKDVFFAISTSGNSKNVLYAAIVAKAKRMKIIGLTGEKDNHLEKLTDVCIKVPEKETYKIQELHLPIYHCLCMMLEDRFFG